MGPWLHWSPYVCNGRGTKETLVNVVGRGEKEKREKVSKQRTWKGWVLRGCQTGNRSFIVLYQYSVNARGAIFPRYKPMNCKKWLNESDDDESSLRVRFLNLNSCRSIFKCSNLNHFVLCIEGPTSILRGERGELQEGFSCDKNRKVLQACK